MTVGLATGMGHLVFAIIITIIGSLAIFILSKVALFNKNKKEKILKIMIPENLDYTNVFDDIFEIYTEKVELEQVKTTNMGSMFDLSYRIILNENVNEKAFLDDLRVKNGNLKVMISHQIEESDL